MESLKNALALTEVEAGKLVCIERREVVEQIAFLTSFHARLTPHSPTFKEAFLPSLWNNKPIS